MTQRIRTAVFVVLAAITLGAIGAATGNWIGWRQADPLPTAADATAALRVGLPDIRISSVGWHDDIHDVHFMETPRAGNVPGQQQARIDDPAVTRGTFETARQRLSAAGWRTTEERSPGGAFFVAVRGDVVMEWEFAPAGTYATPAGDTIEVWMWRFTPTRVNVLTGLGWLLGAGLGALLASTTARMGNGPVRRRLTVVTSAAMVVFALSTLATLYFTAHNLLDLPMRNGQPKALWMAYFPFLIPFGFTVG